MRKESKKALSHEEEREKKIHSEWLDVRCRYSNHTSINHLENIDKRKFFFLVQGRLVQSDLNERARKNFHLIVLEVLKKNEQWKETKLFTSDI